MAEGDNYLAGPPAECCGQGVIYEGEPKGTFETVNELKTYIARPAEGKANGNILFYYSDLFGFVYNAFLQMDSFAKNGYLVFGVDYLRGDSMQQYVHPNGMVKDTVDPSWDRQGWVRAHETFALEQTPKWVAAIKTKYGKETTKYASAGYCFGAKHVCDDLANGVATVGAVGHPSALKESHFSNITGPLMLSCAETDFLFPPQNRRKGIDILQASKKTYNVQLFSGVHHGFCVRCDLTDPYARYCMQQSFQGILGWFDFWLSQ